MARYIVRPMRLEDVDAVSQVERECFTTPWPTSAYRRELRDNRMGRYIVLSEVYPQTNHDGAIETPDPLARAGGMRRAVEQIFRPFTRPENGAAADPSETIVGFAGMWLMLDEAHITTIGVKRSLRGRGLGEILFLTLLKIARDMSADRVTLEVRVSNQSAQALYNKYGFKGEGIRKRYYSDDNEDALIMWSDHLNEPLYQRQIAELESKLNRSLTDNIDVVEFPG